MTMPLFTKSIRWRFVLWLAFLLTCVLAGFGVTAYQLHRTNQFDQLDEDLKGRVAVLSEALRTPPFAGERFWDWGIGRKRGGPPRFDENMPGPRPFPRPRPDSGPPELMTPPGGPPEFNMGVNEIGFSNAVSGLFDQSAMNSFYFVLWARSGGAELKRSTNAPATVTQPERRGRDTGTYTRTRGTFREAFHYTERGDCILAGRSIAADLEATRRFAVWLFAGGVGVLALGLGGAWLLAGRALRPVEEISAAASRISAGNLSERINVSETDNELGQLAGVLNSTFVRLEAAFAQQMQFTADASHELRTPITVLVSEAQTALARKRTADEYRESIEACLDTAQQMRRLTESLLELAHFDAGQEKFGHNPVDLADHARAVVELLRPLAAGSNLQIHCDLAPAAVRGDAERLDQVITNLLANAIHYNKPQGEIRISTRTESGVAILTVADTGQGIAPEDLPHIFERFYRADKSRARANGHTGLGLAICKSIVDAHGGSIEVSSVPGAGTTATVRLPK